MEQKRNSLKDAVIELRELEDKKKQLDAKYADKKAKLASIIMKRMKDSDLKEVNFKDESSRNTLEYRCVLVEPQSIAYDVEKLRSVLSKEQEKKVIDSKATINNINEFITYLKKLGARPKDFKALITVNKSVDKKALEQMYELGEVTFEQLVGCYKVTSTKPYLKTTVKQ